MARLAVFLASLLTLAAVSCLDKISLYPFGTVQGDRRLPVGDDVSSGDIHLDTPIAFYDDLFTSLYINLNGIISFETELPAYRSNLIIPFGYKAIVPFLADVDISISGNVYYRETYDASLLKKARQDIHRAFPDQHDFDPETLLIVTWDDVGAYENQFQPTNTFQVTIASDGRNSFVSFLYPDDGINWIKGHGKNAPNQEDVPAQAGFDSGPGGLYYTLPGSGNPAVTRLASDSNFGTPGVWLFHIGATNGENIQTPESSARTGVAVGDSRGSSCADGGQRRCSANARCTDYHTGFCCACTPPYIGNGHECIRPDEPQRVSGKVSGHVNGEHIDGVDLHAYVVTTDGRTYTAISRMSGSLGYALQSVYAVGSVLGFLFALPQTPAAKNGFMITGGQFNRTAIVQFQSREVLTLRQTFSGQDVQGHMRMTTQMDGSVPRISERAKVEVDEYREEYRRVSPGVLKSHATQTYRVDGTPFRVVIEQTISYEECAAQPQPHPESVRISVTRNFVVFSESEQIVRYSQTNKVSNGGEVEPGLDVCRTARCDRNADCVPERDSYRCVCKAGFEGDGQQCREATCDVLRNCHQDAVCDYDYSTSGYRCKCNPGYRGDGYQCESESGAQEQDCSVARDLCDVNAACVYDGRERRYVCRCNSKFEGDGLRCSPIRDGPTTRDCRRDPRVCDRNAVCEPRGSEYACVCRSGYRGDGYSACQAITDPIGPTGDYLLYAQGMYIMQAPFHPTDDNAGKQTLYIPGQKAVGIDVDCLKRYFYWSDVTGKTISRAKLDGSDSTVIVRNLGSPEGIAIDWLSENIYWTDSGLDRIDVARLDGTFHKNLFSFDLVNPRSIAVDPIRGVMFWTDWNRDAPKVEKSSMDGTDRTVLVNDGLGLPNGLTIDFDSNNVCWADAGAHKVECVNYDGRNRRVIIQTIGYPFGLVYSSDIFYWTDWERSSLPNANRNSGRPNEELTLPFGANGKLYGISTVKHSCPAGSNPCVHNKGGCRYLCLPRAGGGRTCACPSDVASRDCDA